MCCDLRSVQERGPSSWPDASSSLRRFGACAASNFMSASDYGSRGKKGAADREHVLAGNRFEAQEGGTDQVGYSENPRAVGGCRGALLGGVWGAADG